MNKKSFNNIKNDFRTFFSFFIYLTPYTEKVILSILLNGMVLLISILEPYIMSNLIDNGFIAINIKLVYKYLSLVIIIFVIQNIIMFILGNLNVKIGQGISVNVRENLMKKFLNSKLDCLNGHSSGDIISKITDDVSNATSFIATVLNTLLINFIGIIIFVIILSIVSFKLFVLVVISVFLQILVASKMAKFERINYEKVRSYSSIHIRFIENIYNNIKDFKCLNYITNNSIEYKSILNKMKKIAKRKFYIDYINSTIINTIIFVSSIITYFIGFYYISTGEITLGLLFFFINISELFNKSFFEIIGLYISYQESIVSIERINSILSLEQEGNGIYLTDINETINLIEFNNVSFGYDNKSMLFEDLNLSFKKGQSYSILGKNAIGKSTLINLILKFYEVKNGEILINNSNINNINYAQLREKISVTFNSMYIKEGSIVENINFNNLNKNNLDDFLEENDLFIDLLDSLESSQHKVNLNKSNLSVGQKQKLNLLRAIFKEADVYLFDESFVNLDSNIKFKNFEYIHRMLKDKIQIYITHDIELAEKTDNIILIEENKIKYISKADM